MKSNFLLRSLRLRSRGAGLGELSATNFEAFRISRVKFLFDFRKMLKRGSRVFVLQRLRLQLMRRWLC